MVEDRARTIDDLIVPHPSFTLRDIATFEVLDPRITEKEEQNIEGDTPIDDKMIPMIRDVIDSYLQSSTPILNSFYRIFPVPFSTVSLLVAVNRATMAFDSLLSLQQANCGVT